MYKRRVLFTFFLFLIIETSAQLYSVTTFQIIKDKALHYNPSKKTDAESEVVEAKSTTPQRPLSPLRKTKSFPGALKITEAIEPDAEPDSFEFPTLVEWTARCLSAYDEKFDKTVPRSNFEGAPGLSATEFSKAIDLFLQKFNDKGIFEQWVQLDLPQSTTSIDFKYPYVTKLDAENGSVVCFMGDIHGSLHSLLRSLWRLVALGYLDKNFKITKKNFYLVFLGDYVDRGRYGAEVLYTLMRLKCAKWGQVYLARGNHEVIGINERDGFLDELITKYNQPLADKLFTKIDDIYQRLPLAVYITANDQTVQAVHAGFGPYNYYYDDQMKKLMKQKTKRYRHIPLEATDLVAPAFQWCDISQQLHPGTPNRFIPDNGRVWNIDIATLVKRLERNNIKALFRGHQHGSFGLKMLFSPEQYAALPDNKDQMDEASSHYHWLKVVTPDDVKANKLSGGFKIGKYMPLYTFSSAPEGVGEIYDCFGLLFIDDLFDNWRLKVYEFESPIARITEEDKAFYTNISPAMLRLPQSGSGGILDPVRITFYKKQQPENELIKSLNRVSTQSDLVE